MATTLLTIFGVAFAAYFAGAMPVSGAVARVMLRYFPDPNHPAIDVAKVLADIAKGFTVVLVACQGEPNCAKVAALFVFVGHIYPAFRLGTAGNGMAVLLGVLVAYAPMIGLIALINWTLGFYVFRASALAAFTSIIVTLVIVALYGLDPSSDMQLLFGLAALVFWRQRETIAQYMAGSEQVIRPDKRAP